MYGCMVVPNDATVLQFTFQNIFSTDKLLQAQYWKKNFINYNKTHFSERNKTKIR